MARVFTPKQEFIRAMLCIRYCVYPKTLVYFHLDIKVRIFL